MNFIGEILGKQWFFKWNVLPSGFFFVGEFWRFSTITFVVSGITFESNNYRPIKYAEKSTKRDHRLRSVRLISNFFIWILLICSRKFALFKEARSASGAYIKLKNNNNSVTVRFSTSVEADD